MKVKNVFIHNNRRDKTVGSSGTIVVEGLGELTLENVISDDLWKRIEAECIAMCETKLGRTLKIDTIPEEHNPVKFHSIVRTESKTVKVTKDEQV